MVTNVEVSALSQVYDSDTVVPVVYWKPPRFEIAQAAGNPASDNTVVNSSMNFCLCFMPVSDDCVCQCFSQDANCNVDRGSGANFVTMEHKQLADAYRCWFRDERNWLSNAITQNALQPYSINRCELGCTSHDVVFIPVFMVSELVRDLRSGSGCADAGDDVLQKTKFVCE